MKNIKREKYLGKIRPFVGKQLIKILTGQRRVGKSYILKQIRDEIIENDINANILEIDLEKLEFHKLKSTDA
jgi:predicted AAA+ superfamily ATPase